MLNLVAALIHEARPLIDRYRLRPIKGAHPYPVYRKDEFTLIVSGVGKLAASGAVGYLQGLQLNLPQSAWLNIGLSGHSDYEVGQGYTAHRIIDTGSRYSYYPPKILSFPCPSSDLRTVDIPEAHYHQVGGYDMEASGVFKTALRTSTLELIQCYKVVSDNPNHPVQKMTKGSVLRLMAGRIEEIGTVISRLLAMTEAYRVIYQIPKEDEDTLSRWHLTETQKNQLLGLLRRHRVLFGALSSVQKDWEDCRNAKTFIDRLRKKLDTSVSPIPDCSSVRAD